MAVEASDSSQKGVRDSPSILLVFLILNLMSLFGIATLLDNLNHLGDFFTTLMNNGFFTGLLFSVFFVIMAIIFLGLTIFMDITGIIYLYRRFVKKKVKDNRSFNKIRHFFNIDINGLFQKALQLINGLSKELIAGSLLTLLAQVIDWFTNNTYSGLLVLANILILLFFVYIWFRPLTFTK